ncbi:MAG: PBP1A family penicillin-binding protein [Actinomycetota bacterium]|nr:PBP1A family penicillin-binding protein [Actinomycetota bacterium]
MSLAPTFPEIRHKPLDVAVAAGIVFVVIPLVLAGIAAVGLYLYLVALPPPATLPEPNVVSEARSSHIYASDGSLIATLRGVHFRIPVPLDQMPQHLRNAAVAAEDSRFYQHSGVDFRAILRALSADFRAGAPVQGGSTITQQYVKNVYVGRERTWVRKIREAQIAAQLERTASKDKILERYLNTVYLGRGAYGVEAAARVYFDKNAAQLSVSESAFLVGLIPAPVRFSPNTNPTGAEQRRLDVIRRMEQLRYLNSSQATEARADRPDFVAPQPTEEVFKYPWFVDAVKRYLFRRYGADAAYNGGLEIHSTLDPRLQDLAQKAVKDALPSPADPYASLVSVEPGTGYVRAMVGGRDYEQEKYNIAIQGRRQPGSSFKPFVLVSALEAGILPTTSYNGPSTICIAGWRPKCEVSNFDNAGFGRISLEQATVNSVNTVYAQLIMRVGPKEVVDAARRMGIPGPDWLPPRSGCTPTREERCGTKIEPLPALALGSEEVTPLEMASAFGTLGARGMYHEPKVVHSVTDARGKVLEEGPARGRRALDEEVADHATAILQGVITGGTGTRADIGRPAAGKTGTAQDFQNAWFVGYTPELSTAVWVGFKELNRPLENVRGVGRVTGGSIPAMIWAEFMRPALEGMPHTPFAEPQALQRFELPFRPTMAPTPFDGYIAPERIVEETVPSPPPIFEEPQPTPEPAPPPPSGGLLDSLLGRQPASPPPSPQPASPSPSPFSFPPPEPAATPAP